MAAEVLSAAGIQVSVYDAMPSAGAKFLVAGKGGLNLTHDQELEPFLERYGVAGPQVRPWLEAFGPAQVRQWAAELGFPTFVGSSGKVFPEGMDALPLLRAWLARLQQQGVQMQFGWSWQGWDSGGVVLMKDPQGNVAPLGSVSATVLALGGGSWPQTGSDGKWVQAFRQHGIGVAPLRPSNCGFDVAWGPYIPEHYAGKPLKNVGLGLGNAPDPSHHKRGECLITDTGLEGPLIYAFSARIRDQIQASGRCRAVLDLLPDLSLTTVMKELNVPRQGRTWASFLERRLGLRDVKAVLLREVLPAQSFEDVPLLAKTIKGLPLVFTAARPLEEAISTAGGVAFAELDPGLMLKRVPGTFCAGEMLDWEAVTGGYLLTGCMASGRYAASNLMKWLRV